MSDNKDSTAAYDNSGYGHDVETNHRGNDNENLHENNSSVKNVSQSPEPDDQNEGKGNNGQGIEPEEIKEVDISCGIWRFRTNKFGRKFANLYMFALCVGLSSLFTDMTRQIISVQLTSIERQFNIDNTRAGLFDTVSKATLLCTILFAGHFARKSHIPVTVGLAGVAQGLVLMIPAFLQFADPYSLPLLEDGKANSSGDNEKYLCDGLSLNNSRLNSTHDEVNEEAFIILLCVQAFKGITDTFHSSFLPMLYIDDNILDKSMMGIFVGIQWILADLSSPIGKQINGYLSQVPIDLKETEMDVKDGRFVAAWWLAFLVFGAGTAIFSFPLLLFPRKMISRQKQKEALHKATITFAGGQIEDEVKEPYLNQMETRQTLRKPSITMNGDQNNDRDVPDSTAREYSLAERRGSHAPSDKSGSRRPSLFPPLEGPTERKLSITGDMIFEQPVQRDEITKESVTDLIKDFPKAVVRLLKIPAFLILITDIAIISIPFFGVNMFRTVYMVNEYNVPMSEVAMASGLSSAFGHITGTLISSWVCKKVTTKVGYTYIMLSSFAFSVGVTPLYIVFGCGNQPVYGSQGEYGIPVNGSDSCYCDSDKILISCGDDGNNYLSPCYAGCSDVDGKMFTGCSFLSNGSTGNQVTPGLCDTDCHDNFIIYVALHGVQYMTTSLSMIPRRLLLMRIVDPRDRAFANSMFVFSYSLTAIPAPNLFGSLIDGTCLIWDGDYCTLYDRDKIRYLLGGVDIAVYGMIQITTLLMLLIFKWEEKKMKKKVAKGDMEAQEKNFEMIVKP